MLFVNPTVRTHRSLVDWEDVRAWWSILAMLLASCGRVSFEERLVADGGADATAADAVIPEPACDPTAPFGAPVPIAELNTAAADGTLRLMPDELTGYYWSQGATSQDIFFVQRASLDEPFQRQPAMGVSSPSVEYDPTIAADGSVLVFRRSGPGNDLYVATAISPGVFDPPLPIDALNTAADEAQPYLHPSGGSIYFSSTRTFGREGDLFVAPWSGTTFGAPTEVVVVASTVDEGDPVITADGLTLFFRSERTGNYEVYVATRPTTSDAFEAPAELVENVNDSAAADGPSWISPDGCRLYLSSDRAGSNDVYVATRGR